MLVEVCANSLESAINAEKAGADRIEICSELGIGGITPSYGLLKSLREHLSIPVHVLIRPRSGDFTYSALEFEIMKEDIALCIELGYQGIVSGVLNADFTLDEERTRTLIALSGNLYFTFHRAFDWVKDPELTLKKLEKLGVDYILTSGQATSATLGEELLIKLHASASKCSIIPGGGINPNNVYLFKQLGFQAVHLSGTIFHSTFDVIPPVSMNFLMHLREDARAITDIETIQKVISVVK